LTDSADCVYMGRTYASGEKISLEKEDPCTNCKCKVMSDTEDDTSARIRVDANETVYSVTVFLFIFHWLKVY